MLSNALGVGGGGGGGGVAAGGGGVGGVVVGGVDVGGPPVGGGAMLCAEALATTPSETTSVTASVATPRTGVDDPETFNTHSFAAIRSWQMRAKIPDGQRHQATSVSCARRLCLIGNNRLRPVVVSDGGCNQNGIRRRIPAGMTSERGLT